MSKAVHARTRAPSHQLARFDRDAQRFADVGPMSPSRRLEKGDRAAQIQEAEIPRDRVRAMKR